MSLFDIVLLILYIYFGRSLCYDSALSKLLIQSNKYIVGIYWNAKRKKPSMPIILI